ncbi:MAG TPA: cupin domain-containing protein [Flavitalea sp.]|nr:cupin domain-containing protein [Flavitalea sp.]
MESLIVQQPVISTHTIPENRQFPNNPNLPVILYKSAFSTEQPDLEKVIEERFRENKWVDAWTDGIYEYHHYHSTAHEVLAVLNGNIALELGGPNGLKFHLTAGDVIVLPAGVAHKNLENSKNFLCMGAYPKGQKYDLLYGKAGERPVADKNIQQVPLPERDPLFGEDGKLIQAWNNSSS